MADQVLIAGAGPTGGSGFGRFGRVSREGTEH
jgi:hypothetical protein